MVLNVISEDREQFRQGQRSPERASERMAGTCNHRIVNMEEDPSTGVSRSRRTIPPMNFTMKIESFSLLLNKGPATHRVFIESTPFEVGGYKWKLRLFPEGDKVRRDCEGYISLYLVIDTDSLRVGEEICVNFKLFLYDKLRDNFLTIQDDDGRARRYNNMMTEHGFHRFISFSEFSDATNGHLVDDVCVLGAELFVMNKKLNGEILSQPSFEQDTFEWSITGFSKIEDDIHQLPDFDCVGRKWRVSLPPKGKTVKGKMYLVVTLTLVEDVTILPKSNFMGQWLGRFGHPNIKIDDKSSSNVCVKFHVAAKSPLLQLIQGVWYRHWFGSNSKGPNSVTLHLFTMENLHDPTQGLLEDDTLRLELKILAIWESKKF